MQSNKQILNGIVSSAADIMEKKVDEWEDHVVGFSESKEAKEMRIAITVIRENADLWA
jgi:hypothetical protein